jgi:hypothetical protein
VIEKVSATSVRVPFSESSVVLVAVTGGVLVFPLCWSFRGDVGGSWSRKVCPDGKRPIRAAAGTDGTPGEVEGIERIESANEGSGCEWVRDRQPEPWTVEEVRGEPVGGSDFL